MVCDTRQLTEAQRQAAFDQLRNAGAVQAIRPFSGPATMENLVDYLNREVFPVLKQTRKAVNDVYRPVLDNAPSGNPLIHLFSASTVNADPTSGYLRLDNADASAATTIRISELNQDLRDIGAWLDVMAGSVTSPLGAVTLFHQADPRRFARYDLTGMTDQGTYWDLAVTPIEASDTTPWREDDGVVLGFIPGVSSGATTVPPSSVTSTWADILANGATSGANNPTISAGQGLVVAGGQSAGAGDIRSASDITLDAATDIHVHAGGDLHLGHVGETGDIHAEAETIELLTDVNGINISSATTANITTGSSSTIQTATFFAVNATDNIVLTSSAAASLTGTTSVSVTSDNNGMVATPTLVSFGAGTSGVIVGDSTSMIFRTNNVVRLTIGTAGGWSLAGDEGTSGQVLTSNGASTPPTWEAVPTAELTFEDGGVSQGTASIIDVVDGVYTTGTVIVALGQATMAWDVNLTALAPALAGDGLDGTGGQLLVDVSDFAGSGLEDDGANNLRIASDGVTNANLANMAERRVKGRADSAGTGDPQDLTGAQLGAILRVGNEIGDGTTTGTVATYSIGSSTNIVTFNSVTNAIHGFSAPSEPGQMLRVQHIGTGTTSLFNESATAGASIDRMRFSNLAANVAHVVLGANGRQTATFVYHGSRWVWYNCDGPADGSVRTDIIADNAVSDAKLANMAQSRIKGRAEGAGTGDPTDLTPTQVVAIIDGENATWTGAHSFTGSSHTVNVTGAVAIDADAASHVATSVGNLTLQTTQAGSRVIISGADDVQIDAVTDDLLFTSGGLTSFTSGTAVTLTMATLFRVTTNSVERLEITADGAYEVNGDAGDEGQSLISQGASSPPIWSYTTKPVTICRWHEDFECVNSSSSTGPHHFGQTVWITTALSTSGAVIDVPNEQNHPGVVSVQTDGNDNSVYCIHRGGPDANDPWVRGDEIKEFNVVARYNTSNNLAAFFIGFSENVASLAITGTGNSHIMGFFHDSDTDTSVHCVTRESDGTAVDTDTGANPGTTWHRYTIRQTTVGTVEFLIDGSVVATHTTQVPDSESMNCGITIVARSAAVAQLYVDYSDFESHPLTR